MGAFEGSLTFRTFFVEGEPAAGFQDEFLERLSRYAFKELTPESEEDRSAGWVCAQRPLETEFTRDRVFMNQYLTVAMRIDKWSIPSTLFKAHLTEAQREYAASNDLEKLSRSDRQEVKDFVTKRLRRKIVPRMKVIDVVWDVHSRVVRFWSHAKTVSTEFQELFEDTFQMRLIPDSPYTAAVDLDLDDDALETLVNLQPDWFVTPPELA